MANLDQFTYLGQTTNHSGYSNAFLTSRNAPNLFQERYQDYPMYQEDKCHNVDTTGNDIIKSTLEKNPLSMAFFSKANLDHLQNLLVHMVRVRSNGKYCISRQSDPELFTVMRSIYLQYAKHAPYDIAGQVAELNKQVLLDVVPRVMVKIEQHLGYQRDQGSTIRPIPRGELASMAGTRTTRGFTSLFI